MAKDFDVHMFKSGGAYLAVAHDLGWLRGRTLSELRAYVVSAAERVWSEAGGDAGEIEFSISADLRPSHPTCSFCDGEGRVETDRAGAQFLNRGTFDWNARAKQRCDACEGLGVSVPGFGACRTVHE
jgi:hypothetical protein